jgi:molybdate transport system substrate-binding protein
MKARRFVTVVAALGFSLGALTVPHSANAAEIRVLCSMALKAVAEELFPQFEKSTNHRVVVQFALAATQKQKAESGEPFDLIVVTPAMLDDLIKQGKVAADTRSVVARSGLALVIKAGARKPDIGTVDALKRTLLDAKSITYTKQGASGVLFEGVIQKLGIADALAPKTQYTSVGEEASANVVSGRAELGVLPVSEILPVKGAEVGGVFPGETQQYIVMAAGVSAKAAQGAAARDLLKFLMAPSALPVLKAKGMER